MIVKKRPIVKSDITSYFIVYYTNLSVIYSSPILFDYQLRVYVSHDNGYTWNDSGPTPLIDGFAFMRGLTTLKDGTQLLPYQEYPYNREDELELLKSPTRKYIWDKSIDDVLNGVLISTDNGKTYTKGSSCKIPLKKEGLRKWVWSEPTVVELSDGTISMLMRVDMEGYLYRSDSHDQGLTWSEPYKTDIPNPNNKPKLIKIDDKRIALLNTPSSICDFNHRCPLEIWISSDDMETWEYKKSLLDFPAWISYPDGFIEDDILYVAIEFNRHDIYFIKEKL